MKNVTQMPNAQAAKQEASPEEGKFVSMIVTAVFQGGNYYLMITNTPIPLADFLAQMKLGGADVTSLGTAYDPRPGVQTMVTSLYILAGAQSGAAVALRDHYKILSDTPPDG